MKKVTFLAAILTLFSSYRYKIFNNNPPGIKRVSVITIDREPHYYDSLFYDDQGRLIRHETPYNKTLFNFKEKKVQIVGIDKRDGKTYLNLSGTLNSSGQMISATGIVYDKATTYTYQYDANMNLIEQTQVDNNSQERGSEIYTYTNGDLTAWEHKYGTEYEKWVYTYDNIEDKTGINCNPKMLQITSGLLLGVGNKHLISSEAYLGFRGRKMSEHTYGNTIDPNGYLVGYKKIQTSGYNHDTIAYRYKYN